MIPDGDNELVTIHNVEVNSVSVKFLFSEKATKIDKISTVDLTLCSKCQIDGEDFVNFRELKVQIFLDTVNCETQKNKLLVKSRMEISQI